MTRQVYLDNVTYFARFRPGYIKVGFSRSPINRHFGVMKLRPKDADLLSREFIGCVPTDELSEESAHDLLEPWIVRGCREWFYDTPAAVDVIKDIPLMGIPPRRLTPAQVARKVATIASLRTGKIRRRDPVIIANWLETLELQVRTGRLILTS